MGTWRVGARTSHGCFWHSPTESCRADVRTGSAQVRHVVSIGLGSYQMDEEAWPAATGAAGIL